MPLFGKKRDPAQDEAERAEIERLTALLDRGHQQSGRPS
jgi:hypothetical protein